MICQMGNSKVSLSEQDVWVAIQDFLNKGKLHNKSYKINNMNIHRAGSEKAITVEVCLK